MHKVCLFIMIAILTGCDNGPVPGAGGVTLDDGHYAFYGYQGDDDLQFLIVTDGAVGPGGYGCSGTAFVGPGWSGSIKLASTGQPLINYKADKHSISIGDQKYNLDNGRYFVVSSAADTYSVQQFHINLRQQIEDVVKTDKRFNF